MQRTADTLTIRVGEDKTLLTLTDSAVEAVQGEAAGKVIDAFGRLWSVERAIEAGDGFESLDLGQLLELRDALKLASDCIDVLIDCRPLDELDTDE